ncbi:MAG: TIGR03016 family PEP-CTERM system-associated outer membrane protein [Telluria sp.]
MAITTVKAPRLAPLALALLAVAPPSHAGWRLTPTIGMTETATDNVNLQPDDRARSMWVTDVTPGLMLQGATPRITLQGLVQSHLFAYSGARLPGTKDSQTVYDANGQARVIDDWFYVDASVSGGPRIASAFGPQVEGNLWVNGNRVEVKTWRVSPTLRHRFGRSADLMVRYTRDSVDAGNNLLSSSESKQWAANLSSGRAFYTLGWSLDYNRQDIDNKLTGPSSSEASQGTLRWRLVRDFALTASAGYDSYDFKALGGRTAGHSWSGGFLWTPSGRTTIQASAGHRYFGPSGALDASHRMRHTVFNVHYSDMITTSRQQVFLPASFDTAAMLDKMFLPQIPDPVQRAATVQAYLAATGLPPTLSDSINYLSNRWLREKAWRASMALNGAHGTWMLSLFDTRRNALSEQQSDSAVLGSELARQNANVNQRGFSSAYTWRANSRTAATFIASRDRVESFDTGLTQDVRMLRLRVTHDLGHHMQSAFEARRARGGSGDLNTQSYTENAVSATLSMQF